MRSGAAQSSGPNASQIERRQGATSDDFKRAALASLSGLAFFLQLRLAHAEGLLTGSLIEAFGPDWQIVLAPRRCSHLEEPEIQPIPSLAPRADYQQCESSRSSGLRLWFQSILRLVSR